MDVSITPKNNSKGTIHGDFGISEERAEEIYKEIMKGLGIQKLIMDSGGEACISTIISGVSHQLNSLEELFFASYALAVIVQHHTSS